MSGALLDHEEPHLEPSPCTGTAHEHRWLRFGKAGERYDLLIDVAADGTVTMSERAAEQLIRDAGYTQHDPDRVEVEARKRLDWARSRLQEALNRSGR